MFVHRQGYNERGLNSITKIDEMEDEDEM